MRAKVVLSLLLALALSILVHVYQLGRQADRDMEAATQMQQKTIMLLEDVNQRTLRVSDIDPSLCLDNPPVQCGCRMDQGKLTPLPCTPRQADAWLTVGPGVTCTRDVATNVSTCVCDQPQGTHSSGDFLPPMPEGKKLPPSCYTGELFRQKRDTDVMVYLCTASNTWQPLTPAPTEVEIIHGDGWVKIYNRMADTDLGCEPTNDPSAPYRFTLSPGAFAQIPSGLWPLPCTPVR